MATLRLETYYCEEVGFLRRPFAHTCEEKFIFASVHLAIIHSYPCFSQDFDPASWIDLALFMPLARNSIRVATMTFIFKFGPW